MKKEILGILVLIALFVAPEFSQADHKNYRHRHGHHGHYGHWHGGHDDHVSDGEAFFLGALFASLSISTLADAADDDFDLNLVNDIADDAAVLAITGEKTKLLDNLMNGYRKSDKKISDDQILDDYLSKAEALLSAE